MVEVDSYSAAQSAVLKSVAGSFAVDKPAAVEKLAIESLYGEVMQSVMHKQLPFFAIHEEVEMEL